MQKWKVIAYSCYDNFVVVESDGYPADVHGDVDKIRVGWQEPSTGEISGVRLHTVYYDEYDENYFVKYGRKCYLNTVLRVF
jgi:hypothetical protein